MSDVGGGIIELLAFLKSVCDFASDSDPDANDSAAYISHLRLLLALPG